MVSLNITKHPDFNYSQLGHYGSIKLNQQTNKPNQNKKHKQTKQNIYIYCSELY